MKILYLQQSLEKKSELFFTRMITMLAEDISCICCDDQPESSVALKHDMPIHAFYKKRNVLRRILIRLNLLKEKSRSEWISGILDRANADCIFIQYLTYAVKFIPTLEKFQGKIVVHCHGFDATWDMMRVNDPKVKFHSPDYLEKVRKIAGLGAIFIANSHEMMKRLTQVGIPSDQIRLKYLGVEIPTSMVDYAEKKTVRILYLGRLVDCKRPDNVIRAFDLAIQKGMNAELIVAGDGPLRVTCELLKQDLSSGGRISILGEVDGEEGKKLRSSSDIFSAHNETGPLTKQVEALGVSILEAMADGLPVVTGKSGGVQETIKDGVTGFLIEPGNIEEHANAFMRLAESAELRHKMGKAGRARVREMFSIEQERVHLHKILTESDTNSNS